MTTPRIEAACDDGISTLVVTSVDGCPCTSRYVGDRLMERLPIDGLAFDSLLKLAEHCETMGWCPHADGMTLPWRQQQ